MSTAPCLITDELAARVERLFADHDAAGIDVQALAAALAARDVALVDAKRTTFLIDLRVHTGVLARSESYRRRASEMEVWLRHVQPAAAAWRTLTARTRA